MDKIIPFNKGIHRQPSVGIDGELSELVNLVPVNGELVNVRGMEAFAEGIGEGFIFQCIHKTFGGDVYVFSKNETIYFYKIHSGKLSEYSSPIKASSIIKEVKPIGNTLAIMTGNADEFVLLKNDSYIYLGDGYPYLPLAFGLKAYTHSTEKVQTILDMIPDDGGYSAEYRIVEAGGEHVTTVKGRFLFKISDWHNDFNISDIAGHRTQIQALVNNIRDKGRFIYPFFVRCAYKTYTDKYVKISPPMLMLCTTGSAVYSTIKEIPRGVMVGDKDGNTEPSQLAEANGNIQHTLLSHELNCRLTEDLELTNWGDIITSIDVFITPEMQTSDEILPEVTMKPSDVSSKSPTSICSTNGSYYTQTKYDLFSGRADWIYWEPSSITEDEFNNKVNSSTSVSFDEQGHALTGYYLLESIPISEFPKKKDDTYTFKPTKDMLENLTSQPSFLFTTEDKDTNISSKMITYNNRLIKVGLQKTYFNGESLNSILSYTNGSKGEDFIEDVSYYVIISKNGLEIVVGGSDNQCKMHSFYDNGVFYFYYPDSDAVKVVFNLKGSGLKRHLEVELTQNKDGGFSYAFFGGRNILGYSKDIPEPSIKNNTVSNRSSITYTDVDLPFDTDKLNTVEDVNFGQILNISNAAKALSQGQFGAFPLYAFCEDGIWALTLSDSGEINGKQPISRDVCNNPDSVTQIDDAVVFTTDKGLMLIQGSDVVCLSEGMNGFNTDERVYFPEGFFSKYGEEDFEGIIKTESRDFREILKSCRISYDYVNQLLRIYPKEDNGKYYVFSMQSREWASVIMEGDVKAVVADYPSSIVQIGDKLYRPSEKDDNSNVKLGILLTRPIMLGDAFSLKKLQDMRLYYSKFDGTSKCKVIVYASNDGTNWGMVNSLRKRAFKYYRFAVITRMKDMDALSGMALRYETERTNKLR